VDGLSTNRRCTSAAVCLREAGRDFVIRYYSETTRQPEKVLTPGEARALQAAGLRTGVVYQDRARVPEDFSAEDGRRDGRFAGQYAREVHQPTGSTIFFAVDYDAVPAHMTRIKAYFRGVCEALAEIGGGEGGYRVGVYGSGLVCRTLRDAGLVIHTWLAEATGWSESSTYDGWNLKQVVTRKPLCTLTAGGWEQCISQGDDESWAFRLDAPLEPAAVNLNKLPVLRRGAKGKDAARLQQLLNRWLVHEGGLMLIEDGTFGPQTDRTLRAFQASHVDDTGQPLVVDGVVGGLTWAALLRGAASQPDPRPRPVGGALTGDRWCVRMPDEAFGGTKRGRAALEAAVGEAAAGAREVGGDNMGPDVAKYLNGIVEPPNNWCAGFVCWCLKNSGGMPFPYTVAARKILSLAAEAGLTTFKDPVQTMPRPGDIAVWWRNSLPSGLGHTGFVHHVDGGRMFTIEGNRTSRVEGFDYPVVGMQKLLGFVRL
jgi:hypothetical protein